jgi:hypothetical protein
MNRARWGGEEALWRWEDHTMATQAFGDEKEGGRGSERALSLLG